MVIWSPNSPTQTTANHPLHSSYPSVLLSGPSSLSWTSLVQSNICLGLSTLLLLSCSVLSNSLWPHGLQHTRPPGPSLSPRVHSNLCPWNQWRHPTISSSVVPFSSCPQSFPASGPFPMSRLFASGGQSIGASASASVLPVMIQGWFALGLTLSKTIPCLLFSSYCRVFSFHCVLKHPYKQTLIRTGPSFRHTSAGKPTLAPSQAQCQHSATWDLLALGPFSLFQTLSVPPSSVNMVQSDQLPWKSAPISTPTSKPFLPTYVSKLSSALFFPMDISQSLSFLHLYFNIGFATKGPNDRTSSLLP